MKFPVNLKELKVNLNFFEYYKLFVNHFANIAKLLVQLKIKNFKSASIKDRFKKKHSNKINLKQRDDSFLLSAKLNSINTDLSATSNCVKT